MDRVIKQSQQKGGAKLVLLMIAWHADDAGIAWPSVKLLAKEAGEMSERQAWNIVRDLKASGELDVEVGGGRGHTNRYRVMVGNPEAHNTEIGNSENISVNSAAPETLKFPTVNNGETLKFSTLNTEMGFRGTVIEPSVKKEPSLREPSYPAEFEKLWSIYPKRSGANPQRAAYNAWKKLVAKGIDPSQLEAAVERYARWCEVTGKLGTESVQQASTFFGPMKEGWRESWELPANGNGRTSPSAPPSSPTIALLREMGD
jgi:hypothetical protein